MARILIPLCAAAGTACGGVCLVRDGRPRAVIVTSREPTQAESLAAERIQYYVARMTGAHLDIVTEPAPPGRAEVHVGRTEASTDVSKTLPDSGTPEEASVILASGSRVHVVGVDDRGTLHSAYFLLEALGCRWYFPADWGFVIPRSADLTVPYGTRHEAPDFVIRSGLPISGLAFHENSQWALNEWGRGNHLGGWKWSMGAGHTYRLLVDPSHLDEHPEWFSLYEGKRETDQICTTSAEVCRMALEFVRRTLAELDDGWQPTRLHPISPNDNNRLCQCETCALLVSEKPDGSGKDWDNSIDRIVKFANFIADGIRNDYPEHYVTYYVDYHSFGTPTFVRPAENTVFWITQWAQDYARPVSPETRMGQSLEQWGQYGNPLFVYTYYGHWINWLFWPLPHVIAADVRYYRDHGVIGLYSETHQHWGTQHLNFIVFPRLLWDADTDVDALIDHFCEKFYGPAARSMRRFYDLQERFFKNGPEQTGQRSQIVFAFTPAIIDEMRTQIQRAESAVAGADPVYGKRIEFVRAGFELADAYITANHLKYAYPATKDPTTRQRMIQLYRDAQEIILDPRYKDRLTENGLSEAVLRSELATLEQGTTFSPGQFSYMDRRGLWSPIDAFSRTNITDVPNTIELAPGVSGEMIYEMRASDGAFKSANLSRLGVPTQQVTFSLGVAEDRNGPWDMLIDGDPGDRLVTPLDITPQVAGREVFYLKLSFANRSNEPVCPLSSFIVEGTVRAAPPG